MIDLSISTFSNDMAAILRSLKELIYLIPLSEYSDNAYNYVYQKLFQACIHQDFSFEKSHLL